MFFESTKCCRVQVNIEPKSDDITATLKYMLGPFVNEYTQSISLINLGADRLQTGMRGAFGKPQGTVARVRIGQPLLSVRTHDKHKAAVIEALRRTKFKFPGRQKVKNSSLTKDYRYDASNCSFTLLSLYSDSRYV